MADNITVPDKVDPHPPVIRRRAQLAVARYASDAGEAREFLEMLGLNEVIEQGENMAEKYTPILRNDDITPAHREVPGEKVPHTIQEGDVVRVAGRSGLHLVKKANDEFIGVTELRQVPPVDGETAEEWSERSLAQTLAATVDTAVRPSEVTVDFEEAS